MIEVIFLMGPVNVSTYHVNRFILFHVVEQKDHYRIGLVLDLNQRSSRFEVGCSREPAELTKQFVLQ